MKTYHSKLSSRICLLVSMLYCMGCVPITPMATEGETSSLVTPASSPATPTPEPELATPTPIVEPTETAEITIEIAGGTVAIEKIQLADTFDMFQAPAGRQILVLFLKVVEATDTVMLNDTIVHAFQQDNVYVTSEDGTRSALESSGKIRGEYVLLFAPQTSEKGFRLIWGENPAIDLGH